MSGVTGKFFAVIPIAVCSALLVSLFEVLFIMPVHFAEIGTGGRQARAGERRRQRPTWFRRAFDRVLCAVTARPGWTLVVALVLAGATLVGFSRARFVFFPSEYQIAFVNLRLRPGSSLERSIEVIDRADRAIATLPSTIVESSVATAGFIYDYNYQPHIRPHYGQLVVTFASDEVRTVSVPEAMERIREVLARTDLGGAAFEVTELNDGPPVGKPVSVRVHGESLAALARWAREVEEVVKKVPGVVDVNSSLEVGAPRALVRIDDDRAAVHGVSAAEVAQAVAAANDGAIVGDFERGDERFAVRVRYAPLARRRLGDLEAIKIRNAAGSVIEVGDVARIDEVEGFAAIERWQGQRTVFITAGVDIDRTSALEANREIARRLAPLLRRHPELTVSYGGEFEETQRSFDSLGQAFVIALLAMYAILGTQFGSYLQPLVILCAVPFGLLGVVIGVHLVGDPITVPTLLGVVGLAGVSVNDSIVLVDFANQLRRDGCSPLEAVRHAANTRLRPVLLTSLTTIAGLLPSAIGVGVSGRSVIWGPMATAFSFGLAAATVLTLLLTPSLYLLADRLGGGKRAPRGIESEAGRGSRDTRCREESAPGCVAIRAAEGAGVDGKRGTP